MDYYLDPELAPLAAMIPPLDWSDVAGVREFTAQTYAQIPAYQSGHPLAVTDVTIPGGADAPDIPGRVYIRAGSTAPVPGLIYLHGGGFVSGNLEGADNTGRIIADEAGVAVLVPDYRLAPEHPYPASLDDCYATLDWITRAGAGYGIDTGHIGVLGDSSGAALAAGADHTGPRPGRITPRRAVPRRRRNGQQARHAFDADHDRCPGLAAAEQPVHLAALPG